MPPRDWSKRRSLMKLLHAWGHRRVQRWFKPRVTAHDVWAFHPDVVALEHRGPTTASRTIVWTLALGLGTFLLWSCWAQLDVVASAPGKLVPDGRVKVIQSLDAALIKTIRVHEGQRVHEGDVLIDLDPVTSRADVTAVEERIQVLSLDLQRLRQELAQSLRPLAGTSPLTGSSPPRATGRVNAANPVVPSEASASSPSWESAVPSLAVLPVSPLPSVGDLSTLESTLMLARESSYQASLASAKSDVEAKAMDEATAADETHRLEQALVLTKAREARIRPFAGAVVPELDYMKVQSELNDATSNFAGQQKREQSARSARTAAEHHLQQVVADHRAQILGDITEKSGTLAGLIGERDKAEQVLRQKELRAPVAGTVQNLAVTTQGGVVTPGQALVSVVPDGVPVMLDAMLSNEDVGYVHAGLPVRVKLDTYPFQKYGVWSGKVVWVSPDAEEKNAPNPLLQDPLRITTTASAQAPTKSGLMYRVHVLLDPNGNPRHPDLVLRVGMTGEADMITDHRRVIEFLTMPASRYMDEGVTRR